MNSTESTTEEMRRLLTPAAEDYLKTIYKLRNGDQSSAPAGVVTTQSLANRLNVAPPSATAMVKKLATLKLVRHARYRGVELTTAGEKIALEVIRHHRLVETYLSEVLGMEWDKVHDEAERWEHILSEEVEARMAAALGHPTHDPHGAPIPTLDGQIAQEDWPRLSQTTAGSLLKVQRVSDESPALLRHLSEVGLVPDAEIEVLRAEPAEGVLLLKINGEQHTVGQSPARAVFVSVIE